MSRAIYITHCQVAFDAADGRYIGMPDFEYSRLETATAPYRERGMNIVEKVVEDFLAGDQIIEVTEVYAKRPTLHLNRGVAL